MRLFEFLRSKRVRAASDAVEAGANAARAAAAAHSEVAPAHNSRLLAALALQSLLIIGLAGALVYFARDEYGAMLEREEEEVETPSRVVTQVSTQASVQDGAATIKLAPAQQRANGIETRVLQAHSYAQSGMAYGSVIDVAPLIEARAKYFAALDEVRMVRAQLARSEAEYRRADALYRDDRSVAQRVVQEARAAFRADQAKLASANRAAQEIEPALRQHWGETLARAATQMNSELLARLVRKQEVLVQLALPSAHAPAQLQVSAVTGEGAPLGAQLVGPASRADAQHGGMTFFYRAPAAGLRIGMQVAARLSAQAQAQAGVIVPREALIWHGGKAWVYVKQGAQAYIRRALAAQEPTEQGWFVAAGLSAGQEVVVSGAQLLLSEEFRYQIRDENDD